MRARLLLSLLWLTASCGTPVDPSPEGGTSRDAGQDGSTVEPCTRNADCGDTSAYCSEWTCRPGAEGTDARGCIDLGPPCEESEVCDEAEDRCGGPTWCTEGREGCLRPGDCDGDGEPAMECDGDDCDDGDDARYPGNTELCDADRHDEDCDSTTLGDLDADGDGFVSAACCNGDACGDDCADDVREIFPGATELCNAIDDDCNGLVDEPGAFCPTGTCIDRRCRSVTWERTYGSRDGDSALRVSVDAAGNVYLLMNLLSPGDLDGDGSDEADGRYLLSFEPTGRLRWFYLLAGSWGPHLALQADGSALVVTEYVAPGPLGPTSAVLRWLSTTDGTTIDTVTLHPPAGYEAILVAGLVWPHSSDLVVASNVVLEGSALYATLLQRVDRGAGVLHQRLIERDGHVNIWSVAASRDAVAIVGLTNGALDLGGGELPTGSFVARLGSEFERGWETSIPAPGPVALSTTGEVAVVGSYETSAVTAWGSTWPAPSGGRAAFALSLGPDGTFRWEELHDGPTGQDRFRAVSFDERGGVLVSGAFSGRLEIMPLGTWMAADDCDAFLAVWNATDGFPLDARAFGGAGGCELIADAVVDPFGAMIIAGSFFGTASLLRGSYTSHGSADVFVMRVAD